MVVVLFSGFVSFGRSGGYFAFSRDVGFFLFSAVSQLLCSLCLGGSGVLSLGADSWFIR